MAQPEQCAGLILVQGRYLGRVLRGCTRRAKYEGMCPTCYRKNK
jgi:hypothetical protein